MGTNTTLEAIADCGVVAVLRGLDPETHVETAEALRDGGVTAVEVTADSPDAVEAIRTLADHFEGTDVIVGAGTVLDEETANAAIRAGAEFVVSPSFDEGVVETCNRYGVVAAPGVMTPTEAVDAYEAGADCVKVFPAKTVGPEHVAALKGPLSQIPIIPTGGVGPENATDYIEAGAAAVGAGGALVDEDAIARGDFETITENAAALVDAVREGRT